MEHSYLKDAQTFKHCNYDQETQDLICLLPLQDVTAVRVFSAGWHVVTTKFWAG